MSLEKQISELNNLHNCSSCHNSGLIISNTRYEKLSKDKYYFIRSCMGCAYGINARQHQMMHSQHKEPCNCEYRYIFDYWVDRDLENLLNKVRKSEDMK